LLERWPRRRTLRISTYRASHPARRVEADADSRPFATALGDIRYHLDMHDASRHDQTGVFVRLPTDQVRLLDRAAAAIPARKKDLISGLLARHVDPDSPEGLEALRELAAHSERAGRRIVIEREEPRLQPGFAAFSPASLPEVLDPAGAAELLAVDVATLLELAEKGEIPGRRVGEEWRFARQGLLEWLSPV